MPVGTSGHDMSHKVSNSGNGGTGNGAGNGAGRNAGNGNGQDGGQNDGSGNGAGHPPGFVFPCRYEVKAMGPYSTRFMARVINIVSRHIGPDDLLLTSSRVSRTGRYVSVSCVIRATARQQVNAIYEELSDCPDVLMAL